MTKVPVFAVFIDKQIYHEGDERSRTNPGHGYPAYTEELTVVKQFSSEQDFRTWVTANAKRLSPEPFKAFICTPITITTSVNIEYDYTGRG